MMLRGNPFQPVAVRYRKQLIEKCAELCFPFPVGFLNFDQFNTEILCVESLATSGIGKRIRS